MNQILQKEKYLIVELQNYPVLINTPVHYLITHRKNQATLLTFGCNKTDEAGT